MKKTKILKAAVMGVILGTVAGYLFNPKKGQQNRDKVKKVAKDVMTRLRSELTDAKTITKRHYEDVVHKVIQDFKEDRTLSKEAWDDVADELKERWGEINNEVKSRVAKKVTPKKKTTTRKRKTTKK